MITRNEIKINYLNIDTDVTDYDDIIDYYIVIAKAKVKEYCNQNIERTTTDIFFENYSEYKYLPYYDIVLNNLYEFQDDWIEVEGVLARSPRYRIIYDFFGYYKANITYGYTTIPSEIKQVLGEMVYMMFEQVKVNDGHLRGTLGLNSIAQATDNLSGTFTLKDMNKEWKNILRKYRVL